MKKYWKPIILFAIVLVTFSIYYVHGALAKEELPELELVTVSDKNDIAENITIEGNYENGRMSWNEFKLTAQDMMDYSDLGYLERLNNSYSHVNTAKLIEDYRGFMRGKNERELLYEDEGRIVYVGPYSQDKGKNEFEVAILDKVKNEEKDVTVKIAEEAGFEYMYIEEIQAAGDKIYVFTSNYYRDGEQLRVYEIDINEEKITDQKTLEILPADSYYSVLNNFGNIKEEPYLVYKVEENKWDEETGEGEIVSLEVKSYHVQSGEQRTITLPPEWDKNIDANNMYDVHSSNHYVIKDEFIYFIIHVEERIDIYPYHLEKNELGEVRHIPLEPTVSEGVVGYFAAGEGFSFISSVGENGSNQRKLFVIDLDNAEIQYEGDIKITNANREMLPYLIEFNDVYID